jgi:hypothetical protein
MPSMDPARTVPRACPTHHHVLKQDTRQGLPRTPAQDLVGHLGISCSERISISFAPDTRGGHNLQGSPEGLVDTTS